MAIKLVSTASGTEGTLGIDSNIALTVNNSNSITVANAISSPLWAGSLATNIVTPAALDLDVRNGNYFTKSITTGTNTFTVSGLASIASRAYSLTLELNVSGSATAVFWSGVQWPNNNTAPTFTANKIHLLTFITDDGGTTWRGTASYNYNI